MTEPCVGISTVKSRMRAKSKPAALQQRMALAHREHHALGVEVREVEARHLLGRGEAADHQIELAEPQLLEQNDVLAGDDLDRIAGARARGISRWRPA